VNQHGDVPEARGGGMMRKVGDVYVFHGGFFECFDAFNSSWDNHFFSDTFHFDPDTNTWSRVVTNAAPGGRAFAGFATYAKEQSMILYSGVLYSCNFQTVIPYNDIWEYFPATHTWTQRYTSGGPGVRIGAGIAVVGDRMYLHAGLDAFFVSHNDFWVLNLKTNVWTQLVPDNVAGTPPGRYLQKVETRGDYIYIFGGNVNPSALGVQWGDTWRYSISSNSWLEITTPSSVPTRVHGGSAITSKGLFLYLGDTNDDENECKTREESAGQYPTARTDVYITHGTHQGWYADVAVSNSPRLKRFGYVQDSHEVYIWGGFDFVCSPVLCTGPGTDLFGNPTNGTHCYDPATSYAIWNTNMYRLDIRDVTEEVVGNNDDNENGARFNPFAASSPAPASASAPQQRTVTNGQAREEALSKAGNAGVRGLGLFARL